jgi:large repetitive protein
VIPYANVADSQLDLGLVAMRNRVPAVPLSGNVRTADAAVNIVDAAYFSDLSERRVMQSFYSVFGDSVDGFVMFSGGRTVGDGAARAFPVKNSVSGIGLQVFDHSAEYGSAGKLKYGIRANNNIHGDNFLHEFAHSFGVYLNKPALDLTANGTEGIHWGPSDIVGQMNGAPYLRDNFNGTFTAVSAEPNAHNAYADIELYLMGLATPAQVAPHRFVLTSPAPALGATIPLASTQWVSVANIEQVYGARFPTAANSQKNFAFAFVVVSDAFVQPAELALVNTLARYYAQPAGGGTLVGGGRVPVPDPPTFAAATGHRATLATSLYRYEHDRLFDWAEFKYPQLFGPHAATQDVAGYQARAYANGIYLGSANGRVYVYGAPWGGLKDVGGVGEYLPLAIQDGF